MDFINKNMQGWVKKLLYVGIFIALIYIFIALIPILLIAAVAISIAIYLTRKYRNWKEKQSLKSNIKYSRVNEDINNSDIDDEFDMNESKVIDVEYMEVKSDK